MVLIPVYNIYYLRLQASLPQTPTHERGVGGHVSSIYFIFIMLVVAQLLSCCGFGTQHVTNTGLCNIITAADDRDGMLAVSCLEELVVEQFHCSIAAYGIRCLPPERDSMITSDDPSVPTRARLRVCVARDEFRQG